VYADRVFTSDDGDSILDYEPKGGGGTSFDVNWEWMKANNIEPKLLVMFTDMWTGDGFGDPAYTETLFIAHGSFEGEAPHGTTIKYTK
jgi:predicted metal-dependent peptidase